MQTVPPQSVIDYDRESRTVRRRNFIGICFLTLILIYTFGFAYLRYRHVLVHDETGYSDGGVWIRTDWVRLGSRRFSSPMNERLRGVAEVIYFPASVIESLAWRFNLLGHPKPP